MSQKQAIKTSERRGATYGAVAGFSQSELYFPAANQTQTNSSIQQVKSVNTISTAASVTDRILDDVVGSPTFGSFVYFTKNYTASGNITQNEKTDTTNYVTTPGTARQNLSINVLPGAKEHKFFSYVGFATANGVRTVKYLRTVTVVNRATTLTGTTSYCYPDTFVATTTADTGWIFQSDTTSTIPFSGTLKGSVSAFKNGGEVGKIPFAIYGAGVQSASSMIFDSGVYQAGIVLNRTSGGLVVKTPFDDSVRNLPEINFTGEIDYLKIECRLEYTVAPAGGMYFGVLSTN